jgi:ParB family chromosome partitioning protein
MHAMFDQLIHAAGGRGGREVVELPLEKIEPDPEQPRKTFEGIDELAASLRAVGVQQPLLVRPHPDRRGHYRLIAGERRYRAAREAGFETVPCLVQKGEGAADRGLRLVAQLTENLQRRDVAILETARAIEKALEAGEWGKSELARLLGKSPAFVSKNLALLRADGPARDALEAGLLESTETYRLFANLPEERQRQLVEAGKASGKPIGRGDVLGVGEDGGGGEEAPDRPPATTASGAGDKEEPGAGKGVASPEKKERELFRLELDAEQLRRLLRKLGAAAPADDTRLASAVVRVLGKS